MSVGIVRDPLYLEHSNGVGHPERAERLVAIDTMLSGFDRADELIDIEARDAATEELQWVHTAEHIRAVEASRGEGLTMFSMDTFATSRSCDAAMRAAGGAMSAVEAVLGGVCESAFVFPRPPGHHAEADRAMGFCLFNNVAVAAEYAMRVGGTERVLILDWDVHHGNGTMHSFYDSNRVMYQSVHQFPHYPGTGDVDEIGAREGRGYTVNAPLPGGQHDGDYLSVFEELLMPVAAQFDPDLILISAGFDCDGRDPLASMSLTSAAFGSMASAVVELAGACSAGVVAVLEGGYNLRALSEGIEHVLRALLGDRYAWRGPRVGASRPVGGVIRQALRHLTPYWSAIRD